MDFVPSGFVTRDDLPLHKEINYLKNLNEANTK